MDDLYDDSVDPQMKQQALLAALRGQSMQADPNRMAALDDRQRVGLMQQMTGDRVLAPVGAGIQRQAQQEASLEALAPTKRLLAQSAATRAGAYQENVDSLADKRGRPQYDYTRTDDGGLYGVNKADPTDVSLVHQSDKKLGVPKLLKGGKGGGAPVGPPAPLSPAAQSELDGYARDYNLTSHVPEMARGNSKEAYAFRRTIGARAAELRGEGAGEGVAMRGATFKADSKSLDAATHQADAVRGFIGTFDRNVDMLEQLAAKLSSSNSPFVNKGLRWYQENGEGNPDLTAFKNALNTVTSEAAKINSGQTGSSGAPISVIQEMEHNLPPNATPAQVAAALKVLRRDSQNRLAALNENISGVTTRMSGKKPPAEAPTQAATAKTAAFTHVRTDPTTGETRGWDGKQWVPIKAGE